MLDNDTILYLLKDVELDADSEHTIDFDSQEQQQSYFDAKIDSALINGDDNAKFKYIREQQAINVAFNIDALFSVNYLMYNNNKKWYYAYIIRKEFVSPNVTKLHIKLDAYQTFMFDFDIDECFVEREHQDRWSADKKPIFNLEPEGLEMGNAYRVVNTITHNPTNTMPSQDGWLVVKTKEPIHDKSLSGTTWVDYSMPTKYGHAYTGTYTYIFYIGDINLTELKYIRTYQTTFDNDSGREIVETLERGLTQVDGVMLQKLTENSLVLSVQYVKYFDASIVQYDSKDKALYFNKRYGDIIHFDDMSNAYGFMLINYQTSSIGYSFSFENKIPQLSIDINEAPKIENETKLYTSPYQYFELGIYGEYYKFNREYFGDANIFEFISAMSLNLSNKIVTYPRNYNYKNYNVFNKDGAYFKRSSQNGANEITLRTDKWQEYTLNNKASINGGLAVAGAQFGINTILGFASGGLGLAVAGSQALNFAGQVANTMMQREDIKQSPDDVRQVNSDSGLTSILGEDLYKLLIMEIQPQFKNKLYKYFMHYGYKCNDFKKPDLRSRYYFNYIKTIDANIKSNISNEYITELKALFDKGITIWHYRDIETFKGIRNYDFENVEMALMPANE